MAVYRRGLAEHAAPFHRGSVTEVQASDAKTHFSQLLDAVERGRTIVILRHGKPIARLIPDEEERQRRVSAAIANIKALGQKIEEEHGPITVEEIVSSVHEGHKH